MWSAESLCINYVFSPSLSTLREEPKPSRLSTFLFEVEDGVCKIA